MESFFFTFRRDFLLLETSADGIALVSNFLHSKKIHNTFEVFFDANRNLDRHRSRAKALFDQAHDSVEVSAGTIHFVHKSNPGHTVFVGLSPNSFRLWFNTTDGTEHGDRAV